jgi:ATP-dependent Clp protease protease subunit
MFQIPKLLQLVADNANKPRDFRIEAKDDGATIYVYDVIGAWFGGIDETKFAKDLAALKVKNIALRVNSPGGDVFAARAMMTALANHPAKVTAFIDGIAASAATSLIMAADTVAMTRGARMMIHEAWTIALGNKRDFRSQADILDGMDKDIVQDYIAKTGKPVEELAAAMEAETWFNADEAKAYGFVNEIIEATKPASNTWNLAAYKNVPKDLADPPKPKDTIEQHRANLDRRFALIERTAA